jgi:hypothetical protein
MGRLVVVLRWSSDSLARRSRPSGALLSLKQVPAGTNTGGLFHQDSVAGNGFLRLTLAVPEGAYRLEVRLIGSPVLVTPLTVRRGYADTARAFLGSGGVELCS